MLMIGVTGYELSLRRVVHIGESTYFKLIIDFRLERF